MHLRKDQVHVGGPKPASPPQLVKTFDAGIVDGDGYGAFTGFAQREEDSLNLGSADSVPLSRRKRVIIVGAGINGIQQATVLLDDGNVKLNDIHIFDALGGYGGVWQKNKYPGCACDVPSMIYTTSYHINKSAFLFVPRRRENWISVPQANMDE